MRKTLSKDTRKIPVSPSSLCATSSPTLHSHKVSDLVTQQAILLSVAGAALAIGTRLELKPDPTFLVIDHSAVPGQTPIAPPPQEGPTHKSLALTAIVLFYEGSLISLFAAVLATFAKDCLNRYSLQLAVPAIQRSADRHRKFEVLRSWRFGLLVLSPHILVRSALAFLACGVCLRLWELASFVFYILPFFAVPGIVGYFLTIDSFSFS